MHLLVFFSPDAKERQRPVQRGAKKLVAHRDTLAHRFVPAGLQAAAGCQDFGHPGIVSGQTALHAPILDHVEKIR
jgi:hypothetical protein